MYLVIEIQTTNGNMSVLPVDTFNNRAQAESSYHSRLALAAISSVGIHTVTLMNNLGVVEKSESYRHVATPEEE